MGVGVILRGIAVRVVVLRRELPICGYWRFRLRRHERTEEAAIQSRRVQRPRCSLLEDVRDIIDQRDYFVLVVEEGFELGTE